MAMKARDVMVDHATREAGLALMVLFLAGSFADVATAHELFRRELAYPYAAHDPANPNEGGSARYSSVTAGLQSYRPVDPLPWGDVNRRVSPQSGQSKEPAKKP